MIIFSLAFLSGDLLLLYLSPARSWMMIMLVLLIGIISSIKAKKSKIFHIIISGISIGLVLTAMQVDHIHQWQLPAEMENVPVYVSGYITSIPAENSFGTHFIFKLDEVHHNQLFIKHPANVRLSWRNASRIKPGDHYQFQVKLKRIHGLKNPGGFDYEAWALQSGLRATGSVMTKHAPTYLGHSYLHAPINQIRHYLQTVILKHLPDSPTSPWLLALMIGERSTAAPDHWRILRATGTNHLMAIAGLHIGILSGFIFALTHLLWRRSIRLVMSYPAPLAAAWAALISAWVYSALAGFSIPTQRACIMLTFYLGARILRRELPAWHAWSAAMLVVLLLNPLSVLSESFWLSFGTIALIIFGMQARLAPGGWWWKWGRVQAVISFGLLPLSIWFYQETSIISVAANSIAIPWLGFLVLPFCLLGMILLLLSPTIGSAVLWIADKTLMMLWKFLEWFANLDFAVWSIAMSSIWILLTTTLACVILLMPRSMPGKLFGLFWLLPLILQHPAVPEKQDFWLHILDAGQGLAVVIQTNQHVLLFDAGPKLGEQFDMGESVVLPFLRHAHIKQLDVMMISHGDNDHIGGAEAVIRGMPVKKILTSVPDQMQHHAALCLAGTSWRWDDIDFNILYPSSTDIALGNDSSCVVKISNGKQSVLLTGDIEKHAENQLLANAYHGLSANIMVAPHHGSKTSSQEKFIEAVAPQYVIYATGYFNRYHFPHPLIMKRYQNHDVLQLNTVDTGAITFHLQHQQALIAPQFTRMTDSVYAR